MSYQEKAIVKIDSDGAVAKCAKGLTSEECGYKAGAKVCGKCGAMAVEVKMVPVSEIAVSPDDEMSEDEYKKMMQMRRVKKEMNMVMDDDMEDEENSAVSNYLVPMKKGGMRMPMSAPMIDDEMSEDEYKQIMQMRRAKKGYGGMSVPMMDEDEDMVPMKKGGMRMPMSAPMMDEDEDMVPMKKGGMRMPMSAPMIDDEMSEDEYKQIMQMRRAKKEMGMSAPMMDDEDDEDDEMMPMATPKGMRYGNRMMTLKAGLEDDEMMDDEDDEDDEDDKMMPMRRAASGMTVDLEAARMKRLRSLGTKSADIGLNGFMCAIERKVYPGSISVCDDCPGGCVAEKGLPGLLHVEGLAETMFKGDVIDSGYSAEADMFVVDVQTKSGYVNEVFIDGTTAEVLGFHRLDDSIFEQKSLMDDVELINFNEAAEIAVKSVPGTVMAVEPSVFEGFDAYQVEVDGFDYKTYDVYVALDGEVLGWDKWEPDDVDDIEAEAAEISLKRAFTEETRQQMAEAGEAMEDGSFPIAGEEDLRNAIMAHGRAKDIPAAKRFITKRAKELGMEKMLPEEWSAGEKNFSVDDDSEGAFLKSLVEFELLQTEVGDDK